MLTPTTTRWPSSRKGTRRAVRVRRAVAWARGGVTGVDGPRQAHRDGAQQLVVDAMAEAVVDHLEVVDVQEQHRVPYPARRVAPLAPRGVEGMRQAIVEQGTVGEPGQRVVERLMGEFLLEPLALADVAHHHRAAGHRAGLVADRREGDRHVDGPPIARQMDALVADHRLAAGQADEDLDQLGAPRRGH